jgi:hypothetical protein
MPPGTVPLGPACQPVPPPSTMVTAHRSAHLPLPCSAGRATWPGRATRAHHGWAVPMPPVLSPTDRDPAPSLPVRSSTRCHTPGPSPLPCLVRLHFKRANHRAAPSFLPPSLSSAHGQASRLSSTPATEPPQPSSARFRPPPLPSPPPL